MQIRNQVSFGVFVNKQKFYVDVSLCFYTWCWTFTFDTGASREYKNAEVASQRALQHLFPPTDPKSCQSYVDFLSGESPVALTPIDSKSCQSYVDFLSGESPVALKEN
jgi:hypothetical protein